MQAKHPLSPKDTMPEQTAHPAGITLRHVVRTGKILAVLTASVLLLCGCSHAAADSSTVETLPPMTEPPEPVLMYYVTDHQTAETDTVTQFRTALEEKGYTFRADALSALPMDADAVILNTPREDLTREEQAQLESYMQTGGHLLLLMPADENAERYKYLERFLEHYGIMMDYDIVSETDKSMMLGGNAYFPQIKQIHAPLGMTIVPETAERPLYMENARTFHFSSLENSNDLRQDAMLETARTAVCEPCGGGFDDPETLTGEQFMTMLYSRDTTQNDAFVICVGASGFLLDANYGAETSTSAQDYVYAALDWAAHPTGF